MLYCNTQEKCFNQYGISIILPVFNCEKYVGFCIESILNQTYDNWELVVINDGSSDNSGLICDKFKHNKRVHIMHQSNHGLSYARNIGLKYAHNKHIMFIDSDDYIHKDALGLLMDVYCKTNADVIISDFIRVSMHVIDNPTNNNNENYSFISSSNAIDSLLSDGHEKIRYGTAWGKMIDKSLLERFPFPIGKYWEDVYVMYKIYHFANKIVILDNNIYHYFINQHGITNSPFSKKNLDYLEGLKERLVFIKEHYYSLLPKAENYYKNLCQEYYFKSLKLYDETISNEIAKNYLNIL